MTDPKQEETFKVIDRRLFNEEGQLRQDVLEQEKREEEAAKKAAAKNPPASTKAPKNPWQRWIPVRPKLREVRADFRCSWIS